MKTAEEAILFAALDQDREAVLRKIGALLPGERTRLYQACDWIIRLITRLDDDDAAGAAGAS